MSLRLVLNHYLASLRERNELDVLLPELLRAMGHSVLSLPQVGVAQAGVDIVSTFAERGSELEVFLWVLKFGDIGRADLYGGKQAVEPSVREACTEFVGRRLDAALRGRPIHVFVVSNGVLKQEAQAGFTALIDQMRDRGIDLQFWGMDQLTPRVEEHLFDEGLLLGSARSDLRAALASLEETETAFHRFIRFVDGCLAEPPEVATHGDARRKRDFLRRCAAAAMGFGVLVGWGHTENNLKPAVLAGEYLLLRLWSAAIAGGLQDNAEFDARLVAVASAHCACLQAYFEKVAPALLSPREMSSYRPNHVFYAQLLFEELGRLASLLLAMQHLSAPADAREAVYLALAHVINAHTAWMRPVLDEQSIDLALVIAAFLGQGDTPSAHFVIRLVTLALRRTLTHRPDYLPVDTDLLEDAIATQITGGIAPRTFFEVTTLVPMLCAAAAVMSDDALLADLRELVLQLEGVSLEQWWPTLAWETACGHNLNETGVTRLMTTLRATAQDEAVACLTPPYGAAAPEDFRWHGTPWAVLVPIASRLFRRPVPIWYLARAAQGWVVVPEPPSNAKQMVTADPCTPGALLEGDAQPPLG